MKSDRFGFYGTLALVLLILAIKGVEGDNQATFFRGIVKHYIEETSASIISQIHSPTQLAEISSLNPVSYQMPGQGGPEATLDPVTINGNSIAAHSPASTDYVDVNVGQRYTVTEYTVQDGDALSFIASDFGVSMNSIIWANNLKNADSISPGQVLKIPPVSGVIHEVKNGDTIASLAKKYSVDEDKIISFNDLPQNGLLSIGDQLVVPDGKIATIRVTSGTASSVAPIQKAFSYLPDLGDYFFLPASGYNWGKIHGRNGVDIANSCGTSVYAAGDGEVITSDASGYNGGFGQYIKIIHDNGTETLYAHASKLLVSVGERVSKGQLLALIGSTGRSTGCHLHFEVHGARNPLAKY